MSVLSRLAGALDEVAVVFSFFGLLITNHVFGLGLTETEVNDALYAVFAYLGVQGVRGTTLGLMAGTGLSFLREQAIARIPTVEEAQDKKDGTAPEAPTTPAP